MELMKELVYMKRLVLISALLFLPFNTVYAEDLPKPPKESREEMYHDLFVSMLLDDIQKHVDDYYSVLMTQSPLVYPYEVYIKSVERLQGYRSFNFTVVLQVTPVIGAHNSVGKDELTFNIDLSNAKLVQYKHIKTYEIPPHLKGVQL
jgi:hypothetical protein